MGKWVEKPRKPRNANHGAGRLIYKTGSMGEMLVNITWSIWEMETPGFSAGFSLEFPGFSPGFTPRNNWTQMDFHLDFLETPGKSLERTWVFTWISSWISTWEWTKMEWWNWISERKKQMEWKGTLLKIHGFDRSTRKFRSFW